MAAPVENFHTCMHPPGDAWDDRMPKEKRNWWLFFWGFTILTSLIALAWFYVGADHEIPMTTMETSPAEFHAEVAAFVKKYETSPGSGVVAVPPGQDAYLEGHMWQWYPTLQLKAGQSYRIWLSSIDVTHALVIGQQHLVFDAVPGHKFGITLTPDKPGTYLIYCAEFCGLGHQNMAGHIIVTP